MYRVVISGSRYWNDYDVILNVLKYTLPQHNKVMIIVGDCRGADEQVIQASLDSGKNVIVYKAHWKEYGKSAGPIRNLDMVNDNDPHLILLFHNDIDNSKGTKHMLSLAKKKKINWMLIGDNGLIEQGYYENV